MNDGTITPVKGISASLALEFPTSSEDSEETAADVRALLGYDRREPAVYLAGCVAGIWSGDDTRTGAVRVASEYRVDMSTLARQIDESGRASAEEAAAVRATLTRRANTVELDLVVAHDLAPPDVYVRAVPNAYRREAISAARALQLLLDTWLEGDLPDLSQLPAEAIRSFVSNRPPWAHSCSTWGR